MSSNIRPLIDILWSVDTRPEGFDHYGLKAINLDFRTRNRYRWPWPGNRAEVTPSGDFTSSVCPQFSGDGLSVALTAEGMTAGGYSPSSVLLVAWQQKDELARDETKVKVSGCQVIDLVDGLKALRSIGANADLRSANLHSADLRSADLHSANLYSADLRSANLRSANLHSADLHSAKVNDLTVWPSGFDATTRGVITI